MRSKVCRLESAEDRVVVDGGSFGTGHRQAYEAGIIHRDVSEGNVMICRVEGASSKGFIQDFDFSFNWRRFLYRRSMKNNLATWEKYCVDHGHEPPRPGDPINESKERTVSQPGMRWIVY